LLLLPLLLLLLVSPSPPSEEEERKEGKGCAPCLMIIKVSKPNAAFNKILSCTAASTVGNHRLSLVSVNKNTTSLFRTNSSNFSISFLALACSAADANGCPGIGIVITCPSATTPGKILFKAAAAAAAFGFPPSRQSAYSNNDCLTGFERATLPLSIKVIFLTPHPSRPLATLHPNVPAPINKHFVCASKGILRAGKSRHRMSFKLRSTDCSAKRMGSIIEERSIRRGIYFPLYNSQSLVVREGEGEEGREEPEEDEEGEKDKG
jgi:hypothetical protein